MTTNPVARRCVMAPSLACVLSLAACASVGPAPAVLSADLGTRIAEMRGNSRSTAGAAALKVLSVLV